MSNIIDFYLGKPGDFRPLSEIMNFTDEQMEEVHDYIQWLFPLNESSAFNKGAPVLTKEDIVEFFHSEDLLLEVLKSTRKFFDFLYNTRDNWVVEYDHNHLRITRVLKCLMLFGLHNEAEARFTEIKIMTHGHQCQGFSFWEDAVYPKLPHKYA